MIIENKKIEFNRVSVRDALTIKNAMMIMAKDNISNKDMLEALNIVDEMAIKYLIIEGQQINTLSALENVFKNEFSVFQITTLFQEKISAFLQSLPSSLNTNKKSKG